MTLLNYTLGGIQAIHSHLPTSLHQLRLRHERALALSVCFST